jgi:hypothetical protein
VVVSGAAVLGATVLDAVGGAFVTAADVTALAAAGLAPDAAVLAGAAVFGEIALARVAGAGATSASGGWEVFRLEGGGAVTGAALLEAGAAASLRRRAVTVRVFLVIGMSP